MLIKQGDKILKLGDRVKQKRKELGLTQAQLGELISMSQSTLQGIEANKVIAPRNIINLAKGLNCTPEYLQYGISVTGKSNVTYTHTFKNNLPLVSWVQAGNWSEIKNLPHAEIEYYLCPVNCSKRAFVLKVQGASMEPRFNQREHIFVDPEAQPENGSYVVARLDDENQATFKQLIIEGDKKYLKAINPDWPDKFIEINGNCTIVGKVIYKGEHY